MCQQCEELKTIFNWLKFTTEGIANQWGYSAPNIIFNNRISKTLAFYNTRTNTIEFNTRFVQRNKKEVIIALIKHEIAHIKHWGHNTNFTKACCEMGIKTTHIYDSYNLISVGTYYYQCPKCKLKESFIRQPIYKQYCISCSSDVKYVYMKYIGMDHEVYGWQSVLYNEIVNHR